MPRIGLECLCNVSEKFEIPENTCDTAVKRKICKFYSRKNVYYRIRTNFYSILRFFRILIVNYVYNIVSNINYVYEEIKLRESNDLIMKYTGTLCMTIWTL